MQYSKTNWRHGSSLVNNAKSRRCRRAYSRILSGIERAQLCGFPIVRRHKYSKLVPNVPCLFVLTLTSSNESKGSINDAWQALLKRIRRLDKRFEYIKLHTQEGVNGVLHIICRGKFISHEWLTNNWSATFQAKIVYSQQAYGSMRALTNYLVGYLQHHDKWHLSMSNHWIFPHASRVWKNTFSYRKLCTQGFKACLAEWQAIIRTTNTSYQTGELISVKIPKHRFR